MKLLTTLLLLILAAPINSAIRPYEPKPLRQACTEKSFDHYCVPRIKRAETKQVNWI